MTRQHSPSIVILLTAWSLSSVALPLRAADWPVPRGPAREPEPYRYDPQSWRHVPRAFLDDAAACTLYTATTYLVEEDGTVETIVHELTRLNGRKGVEKLGEYHGIYFDPLFQKLTLNEARVHKAGGQVVAVEPRHLQLRDASTDYQVYNPDKQLIVSFPSLEVGDVIEMKWTVRGKNPEHAGQFFARYTLGDDHHPVVRDEVRVRLPRSRRLTHATVGGRLEPEVRDEGGCRLYRWQAVNRARLPQDEHMPSREELRLQVACSTFASWDAVGSWKKQLRAGCWECTPEIRRVVREATHGLSTPGDRARALTYWVRRHIRYVSAGVVHDYTPHTPATVLANRFGDCKDQTQLLAVMLREAGVPAALATLGSLDDGQVLEAVPSPWGTHAILLVTLDGRDHWIDPTASLAAWDFLPRDARGRLCYVTDDRGVRLQRTPVLAPEQNRIEQTTHVAITAEGTARCRRSAVYHGSAALVQRDLWLEVPPGERRRQVSGELQDAHSQARLLGMAMDEAALRDFDQPVRAETAFEIPGHFSGDSEREGSFTDSKVWAKLLSINLDLGRESTLDLWSPFESRHRYVVQLPPAYRLESVPRERTVRSRWGSFTRSVRTDPSDSRKLEVEFHTRLERAQVEPADFEPFSQFQNEVGKNYRVWLTLKPVEELRDAPALEAALLLAPHDHASAAVLARLYQRKQFTQDARRVLRWAQAFSPHDPALWELRVQTAANLEEEETLYRELVHRFPDEPRYVVALGSTLVSRGAFDRARGVLLALADKGAPRWRGQAQYQLARCAYRQSRPEEALRHFAAAEEADPDGVNNVAARQFKGSLHESLRQASEAVEAYRQALRLDAQAADALAALVRLALAAENHDEALTYLRRYTVAIGDSFDGLLTAADLHLRLGRHDDAFELASRARLQRFHERVQRVLGLVHLHRGVFDKAVYHLDKAEPDAVVLEGLIRAHLALGNLADAERRADQAEKIGQPTDGLRRAYALVISLVQRRALVRKTLQIPTGQEETWGRAVELFVCAEPASLEEDSSPRAAGLLEACLTVCPEFGPAFALRSQTLLARGRLTNALADAERALVLSPNEARGHYVRGRVRLERGAAGALDDLSRAAELSRRQDAVVLHWLAASLMNAVRDEEALAVQREALSLKPNDPELQGQLHEFEKRKAKKPRVP